jgi:hypothetical protein
VPPAAGARPLFPRRNQYNGDSSKQLKQRLDREEKTNAKAGVSHEKDRLRVVWLVAFGFGAAADEPKTEAEKARHLPAEIAAARWRQWPPAATRPLPFPRRPPDTLVLANPQLPIHPCVARFSNVFRFDGTACALEGSRQRRECCSGDKQCCESRSMTGHR